MTDHQHPALLRRDRSGDRFTAFVFWFVVILLALALVLHEQERERRFRRGESRQYWHPPQEVKLTAEEERKLLEYELRQQQLAEEEAELEREARAASRHGGGY